MDITRRHALKMMGGAAAAAVVPLPAPTVPQVTYIGEVGSYANIRFVEEIEAGDTGAGLTFHAFSRSLLADVLRKS